MFSVNEKKTQSKHMKTSEIIFPNYKSIDDINQDYTNF